VVATRGRESGARAATRTFTLSLYSKKLARDVAQQSVSPVSDKLKIFIELLRVEFNYMQLSLLDRAEVDFMLYCLCTL